MASLGRASDRKSNLLFILADDHARYALGADGNRRAVTPNLDQLGSEGVRFANHYCNFARVYTFASIDADRPASTRHRRHGAADYIG